MGPHTKTSCSRSPSANTHRPKPIWQNPKAETHQPKPSPAETHSREHFAETLRLKTSSAETHGRKTIRRNRLANTFLGRKPPWPKNRPWPKPSLAETFLRPLSDTTRMENTARDHTLQCLRWDSFCRAPPSFAC